MFKERERVQSLRFVFAVEDNNNDNNNKYSYVSERQQEERARRDVTLTAPATITRLRAKINRRRWWLRLLRSGQRRSVLAILELLVGNSNRLEEFASRRAAAS